MSDLEQQQHHAELGEGAQHVAVAHQSEHRRADDDAGHDLPDHGRDAEALRELGRDLRRHEHDQDVEEHGDDVVGQRSPSWSNGG